MLQGHPDIGHCKASHPQGLFFRISFSRLSHPGDEQTGAPAFGYPAKDQRELAAECRRLKSMLVPDERPLPEISSSAHVAARRMPDLEAVT